MQGYVERAFAGATVSYDRRERRASGELRWVRLTLFPDREPGGKTGGAFAVIHDIEDDIRIREAVRAQEAQLRLFADNIPGPIAYLDESLKYTFVNQAFANWVCRPQDADLRQDAVPRSCRTTCDRSCGRSSSARRAGENVEYERVGTSARRQAALDARPRSRPISTAAGGVRGLYCTEYDIHDLKLTEQALAAREEQLRLFTDNIPEPVVYVDRDRRYAFVNEAFLRLSGLSRDEIIGKTPEEIGGSDVQSMLTPFIDRALKGESVTYERRPSIQSAASAGCAAASCPDLDFDARSRASTSSATTSPT